MRPIGTMHPTDGPPIPADTVITLFMTGGSSIQASDWFTSTGAVANAAAAGVGIIRLTGMSSGTGAFPFMVNLMSTGAVVPNSGTSVNSGSSGVSHPVLTDRTFQVPGGSTGWSVAAFTSGYVVMEMWHK